MPRGRAAVAEPVETGSDERDFTLYASKDLTATQLDFAEWLRSNVGDIDKMDADRVAALGPLCYHAFQASEFNRTRKEERATEREAAQKERQETARASKAAAAKAETTAAPKPKAPARKAATTSTSSTAKPAPRRGRQPAAASAPF
jgi:hypothetical protein